MKKRSKLTRFISYIDNMRLVLWYKFERNLNTKNNFLLLNNNTTVSVKIMSLTNLESLRIKLNFKKYISLFLVSPSTI